MARAKAGIMKGRCDDVWRELCGRKPTNNVNLIME